MPKSRNTKNGLNARQTKFCHEYVVDLNGSQAATRAGYSKKTSKEMASYLLTRPNIQALIKELQDKLAWSANVTAERVVRELASIAFGKVTDVIEIKDGKVFVSDTEILPEDQKRFISEISQSKDGELKIKMHDKVQALDKLCKHLGMFVQRVEVSDVTKRVGFSDLRDSET